MSYYLMSLMALLPVFIILGVSFNLLLGYGGLLSVSHAGFFGVGAYITALLVRDYSLEFLPAVVIAALVTAVASTAVGYAAARLSDEYLFLITIAVQILLFELFNNLRITGRSAGLSGVPRPTIFGWSFTSNFAYGVIAWIICLVMAVVGYRLVKSPYGRLLRALKEDDPASRSLGKRVLRTKVSVFAVSAAMAGVAGGLYATYIRHVSPQEFNFHRTIEILSITVIGGLGVYWGPFAGAFLVVALPQMLSFLDIPNSVAGPVNGLVYSGLVLALLIFRPQGLLGSSRKTKSGPADLSDETTETSPSGLVPRPVASGVLTRPDDMKLAAPGLSCVNLTKSYGGVKAVDDVSLEIRPGQITGLVGPNGAGKTTLFNLLSGAQVADAGQISYGSRDVTRLSVEQRVALGLVRSFQEVRLFEGLSVVDNVLVSCTAPAEETVAAQFDPRKFGTRREEERQDKAHQILSGIGLGARARSLASDLSYADQKLLMMARLIATDASCYLLDEPMSGLDQKARDRMMLLMHDLADQGATICIVEHSTKVIRDISSWVIFLDHGRKLREGTPADLMDDGELTAIYFGDQ